jgi:adenylate kinase family enzyme
VRSLVLVGRFGVGKTTTGRALADRTGVTFLRDGRRRPSRRERPGCRPTGAGSRALRRCDELTFVREIVAKARLSASVCIVGGPRRPGELRALRESLAPCLAIALILPEEDRWRRLREREDNLEQLRQRDRMEESWGIGQTLAECDVQVSTREDAIVVANKCYELWLNPRQVGSE